MCLSFRLPLTTPKTPGILKVEKLEQREQQEQSEKDVKMEKLLTTGEIAKHCQVSHRAVLKWVSTGKIKAFRTPGRHSRINAEDFLSFLIQYKMPVPPELTSAKSKLKRILIVEDDVAIVKVIRSILLKAGQYEIKVVNNGFSAGLLFNEFKPDLVTLDIQMDMLDGFEVCKLIRSNPQNDHVKILAVTDMTDAGTKEKILKLGADEFMPKPISSHTLLENVNRLLGVTIAL